MTTPSGSKRIIEGGLGKEVFTQLVVPLKVVCTPYLWVFHKLLLEIVTT